MSANKQPIFTDTVLHWSQKLTSQVTPREIASQTPLLLGTSGDYGALIYHVRVVALGDDVATVLRLYTKKTLGTDLDYHLIFELDLAQVSGSTDTAANTVTELTLPVLPLFGASVKGLHLAANTELYCGLGTSATAGKEIHVTGGLF